MRGVTSRIARIKVLSFSLDIGRESLPPLIYRLFGLDAIAWSVIATATWLAGWLAGWLSVTTGIVSKRLNLS